MADKTYYSPALKAVRARVDVIDLKAKEVEKMRTMEETFRAQHESLIAGGDIDDEDSIARASVLLTKARMVPARLNQLAGEHQHLLNQLYGDGGFELAVDELGAIAKAMMLRVENEFRPEIKKALKSWTIDANQIDWYADKLFESSERGREIIRLLGLTRSLRQNCDRSANHARGLWITADALEAYRLQYEK